MLLQWNNDAVIIIIFLGKKNIFSYNFLLLNNKFTLFPKKWMVYKSGTQKVRYSKDFYPINHVACRPCWTERSNIFLKVQFPDSHPSTQAGIESYGGIIIYIRKTNFVEPTSCYRTYKNNKTPKPNINTSWQQQHLPLRHLLNGHNEPTHYT